MLAGAGILTLTASTQAVALYTSRFEAPTFTVGNSVAGVDGWANDSGVSQTVTNTRSNPGSQSLLLGRLVRHQHNSGDRGGRHLR